MRPSSYSAIRGLARLGAAILLMSQWIGAGIFASIFGAAFCDGAPIDHAKITEVVNDVAVLDSDTHKGKPARLDALFKSPDIMKTGLQSRAEMVAEDQTITRVGARTLFSFDPRERAITLHEGSILFQSPTGHGGGTIQTAAATAGVLGTTIIVVATLDGGFKLLVLEGTGQVQMKNGQIIIVHAGQMLAIPPGHRKPGPVVDFLLGTEVRTSRLVLGFRRQLPTLGKIRAEIAKQQQEIAAGALQGPVELVENNIDPNTRINEDQALHGHLVLHER